MAKSENEGAKKTFVNLKELYANSLSKLINDYGINDKIYDVTTNSLGFKIIVHFHNILN